MGITAVSGSSSADAAQLNLALQYVFSSPTVTGRFSGVTGQVDFNNVNLNQVDHANQLIHWDPGSALVVKDANGNIGVQSSAMGLVHELAHLFLGMGEAEATAFETQVARELSEPTRENYTSVLYIARETNSTEHTQAGKWVQFDTNRQTTIVGNYDPNSGDFNPPNAGTGILPSSGGGGGGTGVGGGGGEGGTGDAGGPYEGGGGYYPGDTGDTGDEGSVPCPHCHILDGNRTVAPHLDGLDALLGIPTPTTNSAPYVAPPDIVEPASIVGVPPPQF